MRFLFHDSMDYNNQVDSNGEFYEGRTGIDSCYYSPKDSAFGGLNKAQDFINQNSRMLFKYLEAPDVEVLGTFVAIEEWHKGP